MDAIVTQLVQALSIGAIAAGKDVAGEVVKDAYGALKAAVATLLKKDDTTQATPPKSEAETGPDASADDESNDDPGHDPETLRQRVAHLDPADLSTLQERIDALREALQSALSRPGAGEVLKADPTINLCIRDGTFLYDDVTLRTGGTANVDMRNTTSRGKTFTVEADLSPGQSAATGDERKN
ncbi:hypothetical protein H3V53_38430 [Paraburkholderia bengalensis]|uniref:Uncharacterized protein n=1 Tax=Paraburkholderia bengalensis TaxID=2747562 RepID=A0ABU8J4S1_9BURK